MLGSLIIQSLLSDILARVLGKIVKGVVSERFVTRLIMAGLYWLSTRSSNELGLGLVADIAEQLDQLALPTAVATLVAARRKAEAKRNV